MADRSTKLTIKICGLTRVEDLRAAVEHGATHLGLIFVSSSPRSLTVEKARELHQAVGDLPEHVSWVGVFQDASQAFIAEVLSQVELDMIQWHGPDLPPDFMAGFAKPLITVLDPEMLFEISLMPALPFEPSVKTVLIDLPKGSEDSLLDSVSRQAILELQETGLAVWIAGKLTPQTVGEIIRYLRPDGIDVASGVESSPGVKDPQKISAFVEAANTASEKYLSPQPIGDLSE